MLNMVLPKIEVEASSQNYGHFVISPLESGYGITLGNALRRVLLSSLPGAAITSIRMSGIHHEFSADPACPGRHDAADPECQADSPALTHGRAGAHSRRGASEGPVTAGDLSARPKWKLSTLTSIC